MFNRIIMLGNITRECELRYLQNGGAVCTTGLATNRRYKKQDGSPSEDVCFIDITFFGRTAEIANQYVSRGKKVLDEGRLKLEQWTDQNGAKRSKHSITVETLQMMEGKAEGGGQKEDAYATSAQEPSAPGVDVPILDKRDQTHRAIMDLNDDEIPF